MYGKFTNVHNYIAIVAPKGNNGSELAGYYGERVVLHAQTLGLNTCWVGLTFKNIKTAYTVAPGEELKSHWATVPHKACNTHKRKRSTT